MIKVWQDNRLWYVDMKYHKFAIPYVQRMVIIKLNGNRLLIHNPIELTTKLQKAISKLGRVEFIVVSSPNYHQHISDWWLAYSQTRFYATPTLIQTRSDLHFDDALCRETPIGWKNELYQTTLLGGRQPRSFLFCDSKSKTLLLNDELCLAQTHLPLGNLLTAFYLSSQKQIQMPCVTDNQIDNMPLFRASIQEVITWPFDRILSTNGLLLAKGGKKAFIDGFKWAL